MGLKRMIPSIKLTLYQAWPLNHFFQYSLLVKISFFACRVNQLPLIGENIALFNSSQQPLSLGLGHFKGFLS